MRREPAVSSAASATGRRVSHDVSRLPADGAGALASLPDLQLLRAEARPSLLLHGVVYRLQQSTLLRRPHVLRHRQLRCRVTVDRTSSQHRRSVYAS